MKKVEKVIVMILLIFLVFALVHLNSIAEVRNETKALIEASRNGKIDDVTSLLGQGADINGADKRGITPLMMALKRGHYAIVELLINKGANVHAKTIDNNNMLMYLVWAPGKEEKYRYMKLLINKGIDVNEKTEQGYTALYYAANSGNSTQVLKLLIDSGANVNLSDKNGKTPLMIAAKWDVIADIRVEKVKLLLANGADPNAQDRSSATPIFYAAMVAHRSETVDVMALLLKNGAKISHKNIQGRDVLMTAIKEHYPYVNGDRSRVVDFIIRNGANVNEIDNNGNTPLMYALKNHNAGIDSQLIKLLLSKGADINKANNSNETSFGLAFPKIMLKRDIDLDINLFKDPSKKSLNNALLASAGIVASAKNEDYEYRMNMFIWLLSKGADINAKNSGGETALHIVVTRDMISNIPEMIDALIYNGANVESRSYRGKTPLMAALSIGNISVAEHLIKRGARIDARDDKGVTALVYALRYVEAVKLLIKHGANVNAKDNIGRAVLMHATPAGNVQVVKLLLEHGADVNVVDKNGNTALEGHYYTISPEIKRLLIENDAQYKKKYIGIDIIEPVEGQRFKMGEKGKIVVKAKPGVELIGVSFGFEPLSYNPLKKEYVGHFQLPNNIQSGNLDFKVFAVTKEGKETEATRNIIAEFPPNVTLTGIEMEDYGFGSIYLEILPPGSALAKEEVYETEKLSVYGIYSDGIKRDEITSPKYGTTYSSSNERVAVVTSEGVVKAMVLGNAVITARNGKFTVSKEVIVKPYK